MLVDRWKSFVDLNNFSEKVLIVLFAALSAGDLLIKYTGDRIGVTKGDVFVGDHAVVTKADIDSQNLILNLLDKNLGVRNFYIAEEECLLEGVKDRVITGENFRKNLGEVVYGIDSLDGTSSWANGMYEWGVSIGITDNLQHVGGAIVCPEVFGGLVVAGSKENGVYVQTNTSSIPRLMNLEISKKLKDCMVHFGVDVALDKKFGLFTYEIAKKTRTLAVNGSCVLPLAMIAAGKLDALVQPHQRVWDWFAGYALVEGAGGKVQFYRIEEGEVMFVDKPTPEHYNPDDRGLAFIAGKVKVVNEIAAVLVATYGK
jgi:fructose-1,6-bisphosphatase/inositol monophosphatase family enzyme